MNLVSAAFDNGQITTCEEALELAASALADQALIDSQAYDKLSKF
jgi:hypothetical protein